MWGLALAGLVAILWLASRKGEVAPSPPPAAQAPVQAVPNQAPGVDAPAGAIPSPLVYAQVAGKEVVLSGALNDPAGNQNVTVVIGDTAYGMSFGGWDPTIDHSEAVKVLEDRIAADPNDAVAIGQLAVMKSLGLA